MKVAIFNHPFQDFYTSPQRLNKGILSYLTDIISPHQSKIFDVVSKKKKTVKLPSQIKYLKEFIENDKTEYSFFHSYFEFGDVSNFDIVDLKKWKPQAILITSFAFAYFEGLKKMAKYLKENFKEIPIICGGPGPSSFPEYYIADSNVDYVVTGPAELGLKSLLDKIEKGTFKTEEKIQSIDLERNYKFKPFVNINKGKKNFIQLQLTRGCPKKCSYCSIQLLSGNKFRKVSIEELQEFLKEINITGEVNFDFEDDNISMDKNYFIKVIKTIKEIYPQATFSAENGIDFTTLNADLIKFLYEKDFKQWNISLASSDNQILAGYERNYQLERFDYILNKLKKYPLPIIVYFISGLPDDNEDNILKTILYLSQKDILLGISSYYFVPGTMKQKQDFKLNSIFCKGTSFYPWSKIKSITLVTLFMITRFVNAINKIEKDEWKKINYDEIKKNAVNKEFFLNKPNLNRRQLTMIGILCSFAHKEIFAAIKKQDGYLFKPYKLDKKMLTNFFESYSSAKLLRD